MTPRPYQLEALAALREHLCTKSTNPCIVLPTGAGKSNFMGWAIQEYMREYPPLRVAILAHVQELVEQNADKLRQIWPSAPIGIYSAGLGARDMLQPITFASIQSIWRKACDFESFDLVFVDEAHRIPMKGEGMYRRFIQDARMCNPRLMVVGLTATPFRLDGGPICRKEYILNEIAYEANVKNLIDDGYLCKLRTKAGDTQPNLKGVKKSAGDYNRGQLDSVMNADTLVNRAVDEIVPMIAGRRAILFFCVTVAHAQHVSRKLAEHGIVAPVIHADTPQDERQSLVRQFVGGQLRALCNVNVLSEGFDARHVDCIVMLRPTQSAGLYYQQIGRGLRIHESKTDCLVLDFAGNIDQHGPIDTVKGQRPAMTRCPECKESYPKIMDKCPGCGWFDSVECGQCGHKEHADYVRCSKCANLLKFKACKTCEARNEPAAEVCYACNSRFGGEPREIKHGIEPSGGPILSSNEPWDVTVDRVEVKRHEKYGEPNAPATLQVTYYGHRTGAIGNLVHHERHREWVPLEHGGYAGQCASIWWISRFGQPVPATVAEAMERDLFLAESIAAVTQSIRVRQDGKYSRVVGVRLKNRAAVAAGR